MFAYNLYYAAGGSSTDVAFEIYSAGDFRSYSSVSAWQNSGKVGGDAGSTFSNPKFVTSTPGTSATIAQFKLQSTSPAVNSGLPSYAPGLSELDVSGETRLNGGRIDRGSEEF